jgi:hypothetical protein
MASSTASSVIYLGVRYQLKESYKAETTYVAGEFYWQVERGQKTDNRDFSNGKNMLSLEQSKNELTWSFGGKIPSEQVASAFNLEAKKDLLKRDASPVAGTPKIGCITVIIILVIVLVLISMLSTCSDDTSSNYGSSRSSSGSFGGSSSGGGHK